jgi:hypothetical protein
MTLGETRQAIARLAKPNPEPAHVQPSQADLGNARTRGLGLADPLYSCRLIFNSQLGVICG